MDIYLPIFVTAIFVALIAGQLGCFVVWSRMSYFSDSLSHSALIGIAIGIVFDMNIDISLTIFISLFAFLIVYLQNRKTAANDVILITLSQTFLAVGIVLISFTRKSHNYLNFLFGDMVFISQQDIFILSVLFLTITVLIIRFWQPLLLLCLSEKLSIVSGINVYRYRLLTIGMVICFVAVAVQIVGVLLVTSLLIMPSILASNISKSPLHMIVFSSIIALVSVVVGLSGALILNLLPSPFIVMILGLMTIINLLFKIKLYY